MSPKTYVIRRLTPGDADAYQALRLEALGRHPDYFGAAVEDEQHRPRTVVEGILADNAVFGGFVDGRLQGVVALAIPPLLKLAHKGHLWGMYVAQSARGGSMADALMQALLDHARAQVEQITLHVDMPNTRARRFYDRWGFDAYGVEPRAMKVGDSYVDTELRLKLLSQP
ncbi:MAG: GNAT family N-acetyltransferase [Alphaproteobacteria bacterium]|nr:GNAT family N-acetyltransferase [Alphaproteobacteria bacterium]